MAPNTDDKVANIIRSLKNKYVIVFLIISAIAGFSTLTEHVTKIINPIKSLFSPTEKPSTGQAVTVGPGATVGALIQGNGNQIIQQTITPETIALAKELADCAKWTVLPSFVRCIPHING